MIRRLSLALLALACEAPAAPAAPIDRHPARGACPAATDGAPDDPFADCVDELLPEGAGFGQDQLPDIVLGPPEAGPAGAGGTDVVSLGCGGQITLYFAGPGVPDGPGPDLLVFENAFAVGESTFAEPARVLVSDDGEDWRAFPCDLEDEALRGCAGVTPVLAGSASDVDPTDPERAGGDAFDLAALGLSRARYVRLIDLGDLYVDPGAPWCSGPSAGFDLDALAAVHTP